MQLVPKATAPTWGVRVSRIFLRSGISTSVSAFCVCGARVLPPVAVGLGWSLEQLEAAAKILLDDTVARCRSGEDLAPQCAARRRPALRRRAAPAARPPELRLLTPD